MICTCSCSCYAVWGSALPYSAAHGIGARGVWASLGWHPKPRARARAYSRLAPIPAEVARPRCAAKRTHPQGGEGEGPTGGHTETRRNGGRREQRDRGREENREERTQEKRCTIVSSSYLVLSSCLVFPLGPDIGPSGGCPCPHTPPPQQEDGREEQREGTEQRDGENNRE